MDQCQIKKVEVSPVESKSPEQNFIPGNKREWFVKTRVMMAKSLVEKVISFDLLFLGMGNGIFYKCLKLT